MEDPAEIAALAQEFITSLDNLPQEVGHLIKEIEHKEGKAQGERAYADVWERLALTFD